MSVLPHLQERKVNTVTIVLELNNVYRNNEIYFRVLLVPQETKEVKVTLD